MKIARTALFFLLALLLTAGNAFAANIFIGGKAFYAFWDPYLKDVPDAYTNAQDTGWQLLDTGGGWMYGPTASVSFLDDFSISLTYMQGSLLSKLDGSWHYYQQNQGDPEDINVTASGSATAKRQDIDAVASYNIGGSFKIFAGYKYQPLEMTIKQTQYNHNYDVIDGTGGDGNIYEELSKVKMTFDTEYNAPALGIGYSLPFAEIFAFTVNVSGLYITGTSKLKREQSTILAVNTDSGGGTNIGNLPKSNTFTADMDIKGWGYNIEPSIVTMIKDNILFVIGFRYQSIKIDSTMKNIKNVNVYNNGTAMVSDTYRDQDQELKDLNDTVYGVTFTALYKFDI